MIQKIILILLLLSVNTFSVPLFSQIRDTSAIVAVSDTTGIISDEKAPAPNPSSGFSSFFFQNDHPIQAENLIGSGLFAFLSGLFAFGIFILLIFIGIALLILIGAIVLVYRTLFSKDSEQFPERRKERAWLFAGCGLLLLILDGIHFAIPGSGIIGIIFLAGGIIRLILDYVRK